MREALQRGQPAREVERSPEEGARTAGWHLLTGKPVVYVANVGEGVAPEDERLQALAVHAQARRAAVVAFNARWEAELAELEPAEAEQFRAAAGEGGEEPALARFARATYALLGLVTFFSIASAEVRAWPVPRGTTAVEAAGRIHSDMAQGFIRAEVIDWATLVAAGDLARARERGLLRLEGRGYQVQDGDVITFRFAV
jgi:hypothetical protein